MKSFFPLCPLCFWWFSFSCTLYKPKELRRPFVDSLQSPFHCKRLLLLCRRHSTLHKRTPLHKPIVFIVFFIVFFVFLVLLSSNVVCQLRLLHQVRERSWSRLSFVSSQPYRLALNRNGDCFENHRPQQTNQPQLTSPLEELAVF